MPDYLSVTLAVFAVNVIPAFMPPTWVVLALAMVHDPAFDPLTLTLIGALSSTGGRAVLALLSLYFRRFFTRELIARAEEIRIFFEKKGKELFAGTFLYSLSPFPSNLVFIANGFTRTRPFPVFAGFFLGRLVSYFVLIMLSQSIFTRLSDYFKSEIAVRYAFDIIGILAAFSILLVDWNKLIGGKNAGENKRGEKGAWAHSGK